MAKRINSTGNFIKVRRINHQWSIGHFSEHYWVHLEFHSSRHQANEQADYLQNYESPPDDDFVLID